MKFCFFTDVHATGRAPVRRKDNYIESIVKKLNYIVEHTQDVDFYVCGGDIFHTADPATPSVVEITAAFEKFKKPVYTAVGSHDLVGYQFDTIKRSAIGILEAAGLIQIVENQIVLGGVQFHFTHHSYQKDKEPESYTLTNILRLPQVHVIHGSFYTKKIFDAVHPLEDYPNLDKVHLVLAGHIHHPFHETIGLTQFYNPGSLTRTAVDQQHSIKVGVVTFEGLTFKIEDLNVPYTQDVFIESNGVNVEIEDLANVDFSDVFSEVDAIKIKDAVNLKELIVSKTADNDELQQLCLNVLETVSGK